MQSSVAYLPSDADRVLISVNPSAGARSGRPQVERLVELLRERHYTVEIITDLDEVAGKSAEAHKQGTLRAVVAAGGDGTAALVANRTGPGVPMAVLPLGTENLLSKYVDVTADAKSMCETIAGGVTVRLDVGRAGERIFLLMAGCGFDAEVVRRLHSQRTGHISHLSYAKPILDSLRKYRYPRLRVSYEVQREGHDQSQRHQIHACWVFVVNLPRYAAGLSFAPDAIGTDGLLDVCTFKDGSLWHGLLYLSGVVLGKHQTWDGCVIAQTRRVQIESDAPVPYQLDGDPGGYLPLEIEVLPGHLTLIVPEQWAFKQRNPWGNGEGHGSSKG